MSDASEVSLGGEALKGMAAKATMSLLGFVGTVFFARVLGPATLGDYYVMVSVATVVNRVTGGVSRAIQKRAAEASFPTDEALGVALLFPVVWAGVAGVAAVLFRDVLVSFVGFGRVVSAFVAFLLTLGLFACLESMVVASGRVGRMAWIDTLRSVLTLAAQVGLVLVGLGAAGVAYGVAGATGLSLLVVYATVGERPALPSRATLVLLWEYARYSIPTGYLGKLYSEFDILLIRALVSDSATGLYGIALRLSQPGQELAHLVTDGIHSRISNLDSKGEAVGQTVTDALSFASLFTLPALVGGTVLRREAIVTVFGADNVGAVALLPGLLAFQVLRSQAGPLGTAVEAVDRPVVKTRIAAVTLVVNVVVGVALVVRYGTAVGAVAATVVAEAVRYILSAVALGREVDGVELFPRPLRAQVLAAGTMGIVVYTLRETVPVTAWFVLVGHVAVGGAVYFLALSAFSRQFRTTLVDAVDAVVPGWRRLLPWP